MKKYYIILFFTALSFSVFGQSEILDSIRDIQLKKIWKSGESICTPAYWIADSDGGISTFKQICRWPDKVNLKLYKEHRIKKRAVLTTDIYFERTTEERIYIYLVKQSGLWLIDGFNETEDLTNHFLEGYYSGHFTPFDLPRDTELEKFGKKIISFNGKNDELLKYLEENTAPGSKLDFISDMKSDENYEPFLLNVYGYDKRINKGYINFWAHYKDKEDPYNRDITIYVSKTENGKIKILGQGLFGPSKYDFFSIN